MDNDKMILVTGIPPNTTPDELHIHFQKSIFGGGDVSALVFPKSSSERSSAVVKFDESETVKSVLKFEHHIGRTKKKVEVAKFTPEIFASVRASPSSTCVEKLKRSPNIAEEIADELGLTIVPSSKGKLRYEGEFFQMVALQERLQQIARGDIKSDPKTRDNQRNPVGTDSLTNGLANMSLTSKDESQRKQGISSSVTIEAESNGRIGSKQEAQETAKPAEKNTPHIVVDRDMLSFLRVEKPLEIQEIFHKYHVTETPGGKHVTLTFESTKGVDPEQGIDEFQNMYKWAYDNVAQEQYEIPPTADSKMVEQSFQAIRRDFPRMVISKIDSSTRIFISAKPKDCKDAHRALAAQVEGKKRKYAVATVFPTHRREYSEKLLDFTYPETKIKLVVIQGNIATQDTDAIVNAANAQLDNGGGVTGAIFRAGGYIFEDECRRFMWKRRRDLSVGEVVHTKAYGELLCRNVIHVTGPRWSSVRPRSRNDAAARDKCKDIMEQICKGLLKHANEIQAGSIAIPAISTGIYGVPLQIFCDAMVYAVEDYHKFLKRTFSKRPLREVRLVNFDMLQAQDIALNLRRCLPSDNVDTAV